MKQRHTFTDSGRPSSPLMTVAPVAVKPPPPERGGGYHLSEHVKRYYKTTMV